MAERGLEIPIHLIWKQQNLEQVIDQVNAQIKKLAQGGAQNLTAERLQPLISAGTGRAQELAGPGADPRQVRNSTLRVVEESFAYAEALGATATQLQKVRRGAEAIGKQPIESLVRQGRTAQAEQRGRELMAAAGQSTRVGGREISREEIIARAGALELGEANKKATAARENEAQAIRRHTEEENRESTEQDRIRKRVEADRLRRDVQEQARRNVAYLDENMLRSAVKKTPSVEAATSQIWKGGSRTEILGLAEVATAKLRESGQLTAAAFQRIVAATQGAGQKIIGAGADSETYREQVRHLAEETKKLARRFGLTEQEIAAVNFKQPALPGAEFAAQNAAIQAKKLERSRGVVEAAGYTTEGMSPQDIEYKAAALRRIAALRQQVEALKGRTEEEVRETTQLRGDYLRLQSANRAREKAYINDAIRSGELGGTGYQRLAARLSPSAKLPEEMPTLGQAVGSKLLQVTQYAVAAKAVFVIRDMIKDVEKFEQTMVVLRSQLQALGQGEQFEGMRGRIKALASETGQSANDVGLMASRLVGVWGDPARAMRETESAMKLMTVTGLSLKDGLQELVPIAQAFHVSMEEIGDSVIGIQEQFGVAPEAMISFMARVSSSAENAGLTLKETEVIGATMANAFGGSIDSAAEQLNRFLPQLDATQETLFAVLRQHPSTEGLVSPLIKDFARGETGKALNDLIAGYAKLSDAEKKVIGPTLVQSIATPRQAPYIAELFANAGDIVSKESADSSAANVGKLEARFRDLRDTVGNAQQRISETFTQIGEVIFQSGIANAFTGIAETVQLLLGTVGKLVGVFGLLNDVTKPFAHFLGFKEGFLGPLIELVTVALVVTKALTFLRAAKVADTVATGASTTAEQVNMFMRGSNAAAAEREAASDGIAATAKLADAEATSVDTVAQNANTRSRLAGVGGGLKGLATKATSGGALIPSIGGATAGAGAIPVAGMVIGAGLFVNNLRQGMEDEQTKQTDAIRAQLKNVDDARLKGLASEQSDFWDGVRGLWFRQDLPEVTYNNEVFRRQAEPGFRLLKGIGAAGKMGEFVDRMKESQVTDIGELLNSSDRFKQIAQDAGADVEKSGINQFGLLARFKSSGPGFTTTVKTPSRDKLKEMLPKFREMADPNRPGGPVNGAQLILQAAVKIVNGDADMAEFGKLAADALAKGDLAAALVTGGADFVINSTMQEVEANYQAGKLSGAEYLSLSQTKLNEIREAVISAKGPDMAKDLVKIAQAEGKMSQAANGFIQVRLDTLAKLGEISGAPDSKTQDLERQIAAMSRYETRPERFAAAPKLLDSASAAFAQYISHITDPVKQAIAEAQGYEIPEAYRAVDIEQQLNLSKADEGVQAQLAPLLDTDVEGLQQSLAKEAADTGKTVKQIALERVKRAEEVEAFLSGTDSQRYKDLVAAEQAIAGSFDEILNPATRGFTDEQANDIKQRNNALAVTKSRFAVQGALVSQDPVASAQNKANEAAAVYNDLLKREADGIDEGEAARNQAHANLITANQGVAAAYQAGVASEYDVLAALHARDTVASAEDALAKARYLESVAVGQQPRNEARAARIAAEQRVEDANRAREEARFGIQAAIDEKDPSKTALYALEKADRAVANARSEDERIQAVIDKIKAEHGIEDAIMSVFQSQVDLAIAIADAAGNTVEAARLASQAATDKLAVALAQGKDPNGPEVMQLRTDAVSKSAALRDATLQDKQDHIDFLQQMGQLTTGQVIAAYTELLQYPGITEKYRQQIELKIHELQQTAKADYQFNLPSTLTLPTFYEARRATQTPGGPGAYTDNRQVAISINVGTQADLAQVESVIAQHVGVDRYSAANKRYAG